MNTAIFVRGLAIFVITAVMYGCSSTKSVQPQQPQTQPAAANPIVDTKQSVAATRAQIGEILASLNALVTAPPDKLNQAYSRYAGNVDEMRKRQAVLIKHIDGMQKNGRDWLAAWQTPQREIDNPEIRTIAQRQHEQLKERLDHTTHSFREAGKALAPFVNNMEDLKKALANNLTPQMVDQLAQTTVVQTADANGAAVARNLDVAITEFNELTASISPAISK